VVVVSDLQHSEYISVQKYGFKVVGLFCSGFVYHFVVLRFKCIICSNFIFVVIHIHWYEVHSPLVYISFH